MVNMPRKKVNSQKRSHTSNLLMKVTVQTQELLPKTGTKRWLPRALTLRFMKTTMLTFL
ncbi:unnamed protein product [Soboliphyme baturini]|uniref:Alternative protein n=1 Tax=Soboliphyme baturini TaxID=241478 RepID=A0A183J2P2_9BILA|nr:unnamed protein product [Soboliphyme baturini]